MTASRTPLRVRPETAHDIDAVYRINAAAFPTEAEAGLVDRLRRHADPVISLVAERKGRIVGHILFSPVTLEGDGSLVLMGFGPMAVLPERQGQGVGSALVRAGLEACREMGVAAVVVLGHPQYYPRFGFAAAAGFGVNSGFEGAGDAFMVMALQEGALAGRRGTARYHRAFEEL